MHESAPYESARYRRLTAVRSVSYPAPRSFLDCLSLRKRPTEVDYYMVGGVITEGRRLGVVLSSNERPVRQIKEIECGERVHGLHNQDELEGARRARHGIS